MTPPPRVLAIDPSPRGFGYAVLEGRSRLVDWGLAHVSASDKNAGSLVRLKDFLRLALPHIIALEDCGDPKARRRPRVRALIGRITAFAEADGLEVRRATWGMAREILCLHPTATKEEIGMALVSRFPELASRLPPHRKPWMSEDPRTAIFDAVALALTCSCDSADMGPPQPPRPA